MSSYCWDALAHLQQVLSKVETIIIAATILHVLWQGLTNNIKNTNNNITYPLCLRQGLMTLQKLQGKVETLSSDLHLTLPTVQGKVKTQLIETNLYVSLVNTYNITNSSR